MKQSVRPLLVLGCMTPVHVSQNFRSTNVHGVVVKEILS